GSVKKNTVEMLTESSK
ncbi:hypothetical protein A2U01_0064317, partial [Trifolium medium]|nr:hypothetical protein [Trifolium medium]